MKTIVPVIFKSGNFYFEKNKEMIDVQLKYIDSINGHCQREYEKILECIPGVAQSNHENTEKMNKLELNFNKMEEIVKEIDSLEKETDEFEKQLLKVESKFQEFETLRKYIKLANKK